MFGRTCSEVFGDDVENIVSLTNSIVCATVPIDKLVKHVFMSGNGTDVPTVGTFFYLSMVASKP